MPSVMSLSREPSTISLGHGIYDATRLFRPLVPDTDIKNILTNDMEFESLAKALDRFIHNHRAVLSVSQLSNRIAKDEVALNALEFALDEPWAGVHGPFYLHSGCRSITMWS